MQQEPWSYTEAPPAARFLPQTPYDLRPLSTGEVLDRTFSLYRMRFWLFAGIAALPAAISVLTSAGRLIYTAYHPVATPLPGENPFAHLSFVDPIVSILAVMLYLVVYGVAKAATTSAVSAVYLGQPASIGLAYTVIKSRWLRWVGISFWQIGSACWLPAVIGGVGGGLIALTTRGVASIATAGFLFLIGMPTAIVFAVIFYLRNSLAIPAGVMEDTGVRASMRRSKQLVQGRKGRIFLLYLVYFGVGLVAGVIQTPLIFLATRMHGVERYSVLIVQLSIAFLVNVLVAPVPAIGLCLFYLDERVRREGFDVEFMMGQVAGIEAGPAHAFTTEG